MNVLADGRAAGGSVLRDGGGDVGLSSLLDELAQGIVVSTIEGRVLHANQSARHELARRRVLAAHRGTLQGCTPEICKALHDALAKACGGKRSLIELTAVQGPGFSLAVLPLKAHSPDSAPTAALLFARACVCDPLMLCLFSRNFGLTTTEEHVLGILCEGFSAPQIATQMKVAVSTVRSHVRSLCAKTNSSGVRELVSRLAVLPPLASPLWSEPLH